MRASSLPARGLHPLSGEHALSSRIHPYLPCSGVSSFVPPSQSVLHVCVSAVYYVEDYGL